MPILNDYSNCKLTFYPMSSLPDKSLRHPRITVLFCMYQYYIAETNSQLGHCDENDLVRLLSSPSWLHITLWVRNGCYFLSFFLPLSLFLSTQQQQQFQLLSILCNTYYCSVTMCSSIVLLSCHEILIFDSENQWKSIHILRKKGIQKQKGSSTEQAKAAAAASDRKWDDIPSIAENKRTIFYIPDLLRLFICTLGEDRFLFL